jgi:hypothetical protein
MISKFDVPPGDSVMQSDPVLLNEQEVLPINSDLGSDNEEFGFGRIVSIMSLKPEEFEKCGSEDQAQHEGDEACNMDMFLNTEGQLTRVSSAEINIPEENSNVTKTNTQTHNLDKEQECHSEEKSCENERFENLPSVLIPILPESICVNSVRLAELISEKDSELRNILENCIMPLNLSQSTTGSIQLIRWNILMNQIENHTYHPWLQYKCGSMPKLIITGTAAEPDQYCVRLCDSYPDFHNELPPFITFLTEQLSVKDGVPGVNSGDINYFGLLQFDGDNWELVGSLLSTDHSAEWCSNQLVQIHAAKQADQQEASDRQQQYQNFIKPSQEERSEDIAEKQSYIIEEQESRKEAKFHEESGNNKINIKTVASFSPPLTNLKKHQYDVSRSQENVDENSQTVEESAVEQHGQKQKSYAHPGLPLKEQGSFVGGPALCESSGVLIDLKKRWGPQLVQAHSVRETGAGADLTDVDRVCSKGAIAVCDSELTSDRVTNNGKTVVKNVADQKSVTTDAYSAGRELVLVPESPVSRQNLPLQSESECGNSNLKVIDSQGRIQSNDSMKDSDCEEITTISPKKTPFVSEKTKDTTNQISTSEQSLTSPFGTISVRLSDNSCNSDIIQSSGVEVPLPTGPDPARWYMLNIKSRFDLLHLTHSKCIIRYAQLIRAVYLANSHGKTVRIPLEKRLSKGVHGKNTSVSHDMYQTASATQPKFGVYTVPNLYTRVFIGPYGLREDAGVGAIKIINGKLINTMYLDPRHDSLADTDESITALLESGGKAAVLNMKMEQVYDSVARVPEDTRVCRGVWLYTTRSEDKASTAGNVKAFGVSIDGNRVSSASTRCSTPPVTEIGDEEQNTAMDMKKSHTYLQGEKFDTEMEDSKSCSESGHAAQNSLTVDNETESREVGSRCKQAFSVQNGAHKTAIYQNISVQKTPKDVGKECGVEEGEMNQQSSKGGPLLAIARSGSSTRDVLSSVKHDVDVETLCDTGPHIAHKACKRTGRTKNSSLEKRQKPILPKPTDNAASSSTSVFSAASAHR